MEPLFSSLLLSVLGIILLLAYILRKDQQKIQSHGLVYIGNGTLRRILNTIRGISDSQHAVNVYNELKQRNVGLAGTYELGQSMVVVRDIEILKSIFVTDYSHFRDRRVITFPKKDDLISKMLIVVGDEPWVFWRKLFNPCFTPLKMKKIYPTTEKCVLDLIQFLDKELTKNEGNGEIDMTLALYKYSLDVNLKITGNIETDVYETEGESIIEKMGDEMQLHLEGWRGLRCYLVLTFPKIADLLGVSVLKEEAQKFFARVLLQSINDAITAPNGREDLIAYLMENKYMQPEPGVMNPSVDMDFLVSNCVQFFMGGQDTGHSVLIFWVYSVALHPEIQDKLRVELNSVLVKHGETFNYEMLSELCYSEMVLNETMRLYPPAIYVDRSCNTDYPVPGTKSLIKAGDLVWVPVFGLLRDEKYFPNPSRFDPERFSAKNKHNIPSGAFLPFGSGPRGCAGKPFGMLQMKLVTSYILKNFRLEPCVKTLIPMEFSNADPLKPTVPIVLKLTKIGQAKYRCMSLIIKPN